jgi:hypothetical protein
MMTALAGGDDLGHGHMCAIFPSSSVPESSPRFSFAFGFPDSAMPFAKRRRLSDDDASSSEVEDAVPSDVGSAASREQSSGDEPDTEDEIAELKHQKSKKTLKRKHRATDPSNFSTALQTLLKTDAPSGVPLSLKPSIARKRNDDKLESKARRVIQVEKKEEEDKRRVKDIIGGWGAENERTLRKVAQRGGKSSRRPDSRVHVASDYYLN